MNNIIKVMYKCRKDCNIHNRKKFHNRSIETLQGKREWSNIVQNFNELNANNIIFSYIIISI